MWGGGVHKAYVIIRFGVLVIKELVTYIKCKKYNVDGRADARSQDQMKIMYCSAICYIKQYAIS